jgi:hypothetical protein
MPSTILSDNGASSGTAGLKSTGSNDGQLVLQTTTAGGAATTAMTIDTGQAVTFAQTANLPNTFGFKNRIINGGMVIDQRNAGASVTVPSGTTYTIDRWACDNTQASKFSVQQSSTVPAGFKNSSLITSLSAYSIVTSDFFVFRQAIEGLNVADLDWGTASAKTVTLSFWVRSSLTGTFGGSIRNSAGTRSYPFSYTISAANTWEQKTITIAGDTTGTWLTTTGIGIVVYFGLGVGSTYSGTASAWAAGNLLSVTGATSVVGTNGATFYITGVQLEVGSTATSFDYRDYGRELMLCQRYYYKVVTSAAASEVLAPSAFVDTSTRAIGFVNFPVTMRVAPTAVEQTGTAANYRVRYTGGNDVACSVVPTFNLASVWGARSLFDVASGLTGGQSVMIQTAATAGIYLAWSAEL